MCFVAKFDDSEAASKIVLHITQNATVLRFLLDYGLRFRNLVLFGHDLMQTATFVASICRRYPYCFAVSSASFEPIRLGLRRFERDKRSVLP